MITTPVFASSVVQQIEFAGLETTQPVVLQQEMETKVGDVVDTKKIESDVQAIMNLGLFRKVEYFLYDSDDEVEGHVKLVIRVVEKYYLFVLPRARLADDGTIYYGVKGSWHNIFGYNHELDLKIENRGKEYGVIDRVSDLTYSWPRILESPYRLVIFNSTRNAVENRENTTPQIREGHSYGFDLFRWFNPQKQSSGWYLGASLFREQRLNEAYFATDASWPDYESNFWGLRVGYKKVDLYLFNRRGKDIGYKVDTSRILFDSDEHYTRHLLYYRSYYRPAAFPRNNINVQVRLGISEGRFLGDHEYVLGGSLLRGYESNEFTGNALFSINTELLVPDVHYPYFGYVTFLDFGNTYESASDISLSDLHYGIGVGLRWKLPAFVGVDLRLDFGYAIDKDDYRITFGSRNAF